MFGRYQVDFRERYHGILSVDNKAHLSMDIKVSIPRQRKSAEYKIEKFKILLYSMKIFTFQNNPPGPIC